MSTIGPPHLGQVQRSLGLAVEISCLACGVAPSSWKQSGKAVARLRLAPKGEELVSIADFFFVEGKFRWTGLREGLQLR
jgi:hypothetical protein